MWNIFKLSCKAIFRCPKFEFRHLSYFLPVVGFEPEPLGLLYVGNSPRSGSILKYRHFTSHKVAGFCHRKFAAKRPKLLTCFCVSMIFSLSSSWMYILKWWTLPQPQYPVLTPNKKLLSIVTTFNRAKLVFMRLIT